MEFQKAIAWEASLYWRCHCGYENQHMWFCDGGSSYNFICDGCGAFYQVAPPNSESSGAGEHISQQAQHKITPQCKRYSQCPTASECVSPDLKSCFEAA